MFFCHSNRRVTDTVANTAVGPPCSKSPCAQLASIINSRLPNSQLHQHNSSLISRAPSPGPLCSPFFLSPQDQFSCSKGHLLREALPSLPQKLTSHTTTIRPGLFSPKQLLMYLVVIYLLRQNFMYPRLDENLVGSQKEHLIPPLPRHHHLYLPSAGMRGHHATMPDLSDLGD